jgi:hypothetical protein
LQIILILTPDLSVDGGHKAMVSSTTGKLENLFHIGHTQMGLHLDDRTFPLDASAADLSRLLSSWPHLPAAAERHLKRLWK